MKNQNNEIPGQKEVTRFYNQLIFPSNISRKNYENLVPKNLYGKRVGDFGCGQSLFIEIFRNLKYDAVFLDISQNAIDSINYGETICASLTEIPLKDKSMDYIFCIGVVHHIPKMEIAISEMIRVLCPGGELVLGVYAKGTITEFIKNRYDKSRSKIGKKLIEMITRLLMWYKNRNAGINKQELQKRVDDLLITPLARYLPVDDYIKIIKNFGCEVKKVERLNQMNILRIIK